MKLQRVSLLALLLTSCSIGICQEAPDNIAKTQVESPSVDNLYEDWKNESLALRFSNISDPYYENEQIDAFRRTGVNSVALCVLKVQQGDDLIFFPGAYFSALRAISRTAFHYKVVKTPETPQRTVLAVEEFPGLEIGRRVGQERELWLKWWAEKDAKIPIWFRGRYQMWKTAKAGKDKAKTDAAYRKTVDLGIFALPQWMEKLQSDPKESKAIIAAISELSSQEVAPDATPAQVKQWWKANKDKWTKVTLDDVAAPPK